MPARHGLNPVVIIFLAIAGLFVGSLIWIVARNQAERRALWLPPRCENEPRVSFSPKKTTPTSESEGSVPPPGSACGQELSSLAWLPLFGFGTALRCPNCGTRQPLWRVAIELLTAFYFAVAAWRVDEGLHLAAVLVFAIPLLVILLVDTWTRLIYTNVIYGGIALGLIFAVAEDGLGGIGNALIAIVIAIAIFGCFYLFAILLYRNVRVVPFGKGDVYLAAMIAAMIYNRSDLILALFLGVLLAAVGGILLMALKIATRRQAMPYGPYLCLGALIALIW